MVEPKYVRLDFPSSLAHVVEECGETLAACGKTLRFGWDSVNPELPENKQETNGAWVRRELHDLKAAIARLEAAIEKEFY